MPAASDDEPPCEACAASPARIELGGVSLCDRCFDDRVAAQTGYPTLPDPPSPVVRRGADGRSHRFQYRLWRAPTGIVAEAEEVRPAALEPFEGYEFEIRIDDMETVGDLGLPGPDDAPSRLH